MPSSSEDDLFEVRKRILVVDQEAKNEIHRQEALYWKVKREIMVAETVAKGINLPSSAPTVIMTLLHHAYSVGNLT